MTILSIFIIWVYYFILLIIIIMIIEKAVYRVVSANTWVSNKNGKEFAIFELKSENWFSVNKFVWNPSDSVK